MVFQSEKTLAEIGDKLPEADKEEVKSALEKLKATIAGGNTDAIKADTEALEKAFYTLSEKLYKQSGAQGADPNMGGAQGGADGDGTYYNADYEDKTNG
jgi:molecular chaperone DnaK